MIVKWSSHTFRFKDANNHWHIFKNEEKAKKIYIDFMESNNLNKDDNALYVYDYGNMSHKII